MIAVFIRDASVIVDDNAICGTKIAPRFDFVDRLS